MFCTERISMIIYQKFDKTCKKKYGSFSLHRQTCRLARIASNMNVHRVATISGF